MALHIIDRRLAGKNKSVGNRERFVRRFKDQIAEAARRAVSSRDIRNIDQAESITIPRKDIREPVFKHGQGGIRDMVLPGNQEHVRGDRLARPRGGSGGAGSQASDGGEGQDDFSFTLTKEEFMDLFFEDLALPRLLRNHIANTLQYKTRRAGYSQDGTPNNLAVVRTMRGALGRRIALTKAPNREIHALEEELNTLHAQGDDGSDAVIELRRRIAALKERVGQLLTSVGLAAADMAKYPHQFSGGQRQRISIARALATEPEFLVCDEPTSALDVSVQAQVLNIMKDLQKKQGLTYLFISHNLAVVRHVSDQVGVMYLGRLVELADKQQLFASPRHPYTRMLLDAIPKMHDTGRARTPVQGEVPNPLNPPPGCAFNPRCPFANDRCRSERPQLLNQGGTRVACHAVEEGRISGA